MARTESKRARSAHARKLAELKALQKKSKRTGFPVQQLRKPKHKAKPKQRN